MSGMNPFGVSQSFSSLCAFWGAGGGKERNVSKVETKVTITFDYMSC